MILGEVVMLCALASGPGCRPARRDDEPESPLGSYTTSTDTAEKTVIHFPTAKMSDFIKADFLSLRGVTSVDVSQRGDHYAVEVHLGDFTRRTRRDVYATELSLLNEFPSVNFEFDVVDASKQALADGALG